MGELQRLKLGGQERSAPAFTLTLTTGAPERLRSVASIFLEKLAATHTSIFFRPALRLYFFQSLVRQVNLELRRGQITDERRAIMYLGFTVTTVSKKSATRIYKKVISIRMLRLTRRQL